MLDDRAKELGRLIGQSDQYKAVRRANDALGADKDAVTLTAAQWRHDDETRLDDSVSLSRSTQEGML